MQYYQFLILAALDIVIGIFVFTRRPRNQAHIAFGLTSLVLAVWIGSLYILLRASDHKTALFWGRMVFTVGMLGPAAILHFILSFPNRRLLKEHLVIIYGIGSIALIICMSPWVIANVRLDQTGLIPIPGKAYWFIVAYFVTYLVMVIYFTFRRYQKARGLEKLQLFYVLLGFTFFLTHIILTNLILPLLNFKNIFILGPWATVELLGLFGYAILRYRLLDIEIVIKKTTLYLVLVAFIIGIYTFLLMLPQRYFGTTGSSSVLFMLLTAAVITFTLQPLRDWLDNITDKIFFQKKYDYYMVLEKIARELSSVMKMTEILNIVTRTLLDEMHLKNVGIYLRERSNTSTFACHMKEGDLPKQFPEQLSEGDPLLEYLIDKRQLIESGEFRHQFGYLYAEGKILDQNKYDIQEELDNKFQAALIVPLIQKKTIQGFIALGEKKSGDLFTSRDLTLLETLSSQMTTALENVQLYDQMIANERLTVIGTLAAGIAHEIRNPLASIKTFIQMLPEKYNQEDFRHRFHTVVGSEIDRLSTITADLLTFARPSAPKLDTLNMDYLMDKVKTLMASPFRKKQIEFSWNLAHLPNIQADPQQIFQIVLNIVINAVHASHEKGQIKVYGEIKDQAPGHPSGKGLYLMVTIEDFGTGIKRKDMVNLFQPFFTTKTEGTGLGLATCKRILEAHRGDIYIESEEGKGTKVTIMLPTNLTQDAVIIPIAAPIRKFE